MTDRRTTVAVRRPHAIRFSVLNWSAWTPGRETRAAWLEWAGVECRDEDKPLTAPLPPSVRRRLSSFGQKVIGVVSACAEELPPARYILSTRHGELARALGVIDAIIADEPPSPTDFSMSIHHALLGLLSIHTSNRKGHTALSAGWDTFACGLLEAAACVTENPTEPVILIHGDEPLPSEYEPFREVDVLQPQVIAIALGSPIDESARRFSVEASSAIADAPPTSNMPAEFIRFLVSDRPKACIFGHRAQWIWRRVA